MPDRKKAQRPTQDKQMETLTAQSKRLREQADKLQQRMPELDSCLQPSFPITMYAGGAA